MKDKTDRISVRDDSDDRVLDVLLTETGPFVETKTSKGRKRVPLQEVINAIPEDRRNNIRI